MGCYYTGWGVSIRVGVLVYGKVCSYTEWGVSCERSEPITRVSWRISLVYIYLYPWADHLVPRGPPVTRNAQTSDQPVEVQWLI